MRRWDTADNPDDANSNPTNGDRGVGYETVHLQALLDEQGRISVLAIHNSDISDGREREGEHLDYFKVFFEARAYPPGNTIIFSLVTP
ncbi:MAG: hypothetical protein RL077_2222 [Verrucomicrobiota bacterium]|jgi:hypothetical protein